MLSFAVTAFREMSPQRERGERLLRCIHAAQQHEAVDEIIIVNDGSGDYRMLEIFLHNQYKVRLFQNPENLGVFTNKLEAIGCSSEDWVITCDSDNAMDAEYIDWIATAEKDEKTWYCPSFAKPNFDYRHLVGRYGLADIGEFLTRPTSHCAMNTGNQVVHRDRFLSVFGRFVGIRRFDLQLPNYLNLRESRRDLESSWLTYGACDSFLYNMHWLLAGGSLEFVPELQYEHHVHRDPKGSNYDRAPREKVQLAGVLVDELKTASRIAARGVQS